MDVPVGSTLPGGSRSVIMHLTRRFFFTSICKVCQGDLGSDAAKVEASCCRRLSWHAFCFEWAMNKMPPRRLYFRLTCCDAIFSKQLPCDAVSRYREGAPRHLDDRLLDVTYRQTVVGSPQTLLQTIVIEDIRSRALSNNEASEQVRREEWQREARYRQQLARQRLERPVTPDVEECWYRKW